MEYDDFKQAWTAALRASRLPVIGADLAHETVDLRTLDRSGESLVEGGSGVAEPFHVSAKLSWRWHALHTARTATSEEDLLTELLGRDPASRARTARPWLRVDVVLRAGLPWERPMAMPPGHAWATWKQRVDVTVQLIDEEDAVRKARNGELEIMAWQGQPEAQVLADDRGELRLAAIELAAWQAVPLARRWSDSTRKQDVGTGVQLQVFFDRVTAALSAWASAVALLAKAG